MSAVRGFVRADIARFTLCRRARFLRLKAETVGREDLGAWRERIVCDWLTEILLADPHRRLDEIMDAIPFKDEDEILNDYSDARREP
jgi:hypothetical protein